MAPLSAALAVAATLVAGWTVDGCNAFAFSGPTPNSRLVVSSSSTHATRVVPVRMGDEAVVDVLSDLEELDSLVTDRSDDADLEPSQAYLNKLAMQAAVRQWQRDEKDSGSPEVQIAVSTERIVYLTRHLQSNPKDFHTRRGLVALVNRRRDLLNYLFRNDPQKCMEMCRSLGIRFRPKSSVKSRETKYASFKNTKSKVGMRKAVEIQTRELRAQEAAAASEE